MGLFTKKPIYHCVKDGDSDDEVSSSRSSYLKDFVRHPLPIAVITGACTLLVFLAGYMLGSSATSQFVRSSLESETTDLPPFLKLTPPPAHDIFDIFRNLPPVDLYTEYGLNLTEENLYPNPLGKKLCIVNIDTRAWEIDRELSNQTDLGWSWLNHYLYGNFSTTNLRHRVLTCSSPNSRLRLQIHTSSQATRLLSHLGQAQGTLPHDHERRIRCYCHDRCRHRFQRPACSA